MTAGEIISEVFFPVQFEDTIDYMLDRMGEYKVSQLPVVKEESLIGLVYEDDLIAFSEQVEGGAVSGINQSLRYFFIYENQHIYDVLRTLHLNNLDVLPVLDANNAYVGAILGSDMPHVLATYLLSDEPSSVVVLEMNNRDSSLAHIAQIVESDNAQILNAAVRYIPDSTKAEVTLSINRTDIGSIIAAFTRHDYAVRATFNDIKHHDDTRVRYDHLMNYLDL